MWIPPVIAVNTLHKRFVFGRRIRTLAALVDALLPHRAEVLDIGCGDGALAAELVRRRPDISITGADVLVRPDTQIRVQQFDGVRLPFANDSFDVAMFIDVLHHTDDSIAALREAKRVTRSAIVVKDHAIGGFGARPTLVLMDWVGNAHHGVRLPYNYWSVVQWKTAFAYLGLEVARWNSSLGVYPRPFSLIFDRDLHFLAQLVKGSGSSVTPARL
jgi:SAM-dependent methyltransferase